MSKIENYKHPLHFYFLATIIPWSFWSLAGYLSHQPTSNQLLISLLGFMGLVAPVIVAFWLIGRDRTLLDDFKKRVVNFSEIRPIYLFLALFLMPISILTAQVISLLFGYSASQFIITGEYTFSSGVFPVLFLLIVAPIIEEIAWHSYGTDALRNKFNLLNTSLIFALFWGLWHIPLSSIDGYYQSNIANESWVYGVNFLVSIFPFVIIMNWLYYKTGRNIIIPILFHITAGYFNEIFSTHPDTKVIQTALLMLFAFWIVWKERGFFLTNERERNNG